MKWWMQLVLVVLDFSLAGWGLMVFWSAHRLVAAVRRGLEREKALLRELEAAGDSLQQVANIAQKFDNELREVRAVLKAWDHETTVEAARRVSQGDKYEPVWS